MSQMNQMNTCIQTFTGRMVDPLNLTPDQVVIEDIAHALAMQCRFNGHCLKFYSVAEHCLHVSRLCPPEHRLWGLLHDASEAYLTDVPSPVKSVMEEFKRHEQAVHTVIAQRFQLPWPMPEAVTQADRWLLAAERHSLMRPSAEPWPGLLTSYPDTIRIAACNPGRARRLFLREFFTLWKGHRHHGTITV
jgi:hypothetical protein